MEWKLIATVFGLSAYVYAILLNIENWKSNILFGIAALFGLARLVFFCLRQWQEYQLRKFEVREKNKKESI